MGVCACSAKHESQATDRPPDEPLRPTTDIYVRERPTRTDNETELHTDVRHQDLPETLANNPSVHRTFPPGNGSECAGSGSRGSNKEDSAGHSIPFPDGSSYKVGQSIYQKQKVRVYQCMQSTGKFLSMKFVYVGCLQKLSDEDLSEDNFKICQDIVDFIKFKLFPLNHPNLAKYIHAHFDLAKQRTLYSPGLEIGTEYLPESLLQIRQNFGPFEEKAIPKYITQVLAALDYLHSFDIEA